MGHCSKEVEKTEIHVDVIGDYENIRGSHELFYHKDNNRTMHWNMTTPNVGLIDHV